MKPNMNAADRWASLIGGSLLASYGMTQRSWKGAAMAVAGAGLIWRGASGQCGFKSALQDRVRGTGEPVRLNRTLTIPNKSPEQVYEFWRDLENLPKLIRGLESVKAIDSRRSHWVAAGLPGSTIEWDSEITNDRAPHVIEWRSLPGSSLDISGVVRFKRKRERGTKVHVSLQFTPPGGALGEALMNLLQTRPESQVDAGLQHFREALEHV